MPCVTIMSFLRVFLLSPNTPSKPIQKDHGGRLRNRGVVEGNFCHNIGIAIGPDIAPGDQIGCGIQGMYRKCQDFDKGAIRQIITGCSGRFGKKWAAIGAANNRSPFILYQKRSASASFVIDSDLGNHQTIKEQRQSVMRIPRP